MPYVIMLWPYIVLTVLTPSFCFDVEQGLISVAVIYRHGDRTPITTYPNDPYKNASFWPVGFAQLTNTGKMQHFLLGQWLRNRYKHFLPEQYSEKDIYVRSTNLDRTLMSAEANLAGLYPPRGKQVWKNDLLWQPIPIHTAPERLDNVLGMKCPCAKYTYLAEKLANSPQFIKINQSNQELYNYLSKNAGKRIDDLQNLLYLYDTLFIETLQNYTLPEWTKQVFPDELEKWAAFTFALEVYTKEMARLRIGPLFNDIVNHFEQSMIETSYKFVVYSAHDITIANLLNGLDLFEYHCPPYGATILFELRLINESYFINILYKNSSIPQKLTLKDCNYYCPLEHFKKVLEPLLITPEQWEVECDELNSYDIAEKSLFGIGVIFLIILTIWGISRIILKKKTLHHHTYAPVPDQENVYN